MIVKNFRLLKSLSALSRAFSKNPVKNPADLGEIFSAKDVKTHLDLNDRTIDLKRNDEGMLFQSRYFTDEQYLKFFGKLIRSRDQ